MSVEITPSQQLGFPRPLTQLVKRSMTIHNPNSSPIAFKVKTTAPKQYCVRPNSGRVEAGETLEVLGGFWPKGVVKADGLSSLLPAAPTHCNAPIHTIPPPVLLQPLATEPPPHAKCKDKFLVQSAYISPDEEMKSLGEMWAETEKTNKGAIKEQKVKCVYLPAEDGSMGQNGIPEENEDVGMNGDHSRLMDESFDNDGFGRWTTTSSKKYDSDIFHNKGYTHYELDTGPYIPPVTQVFAAAPASPTQANGDHPSPVEHVPATAKSTSSESRSSQVNEPPLPALTAKDIDAQPSGVSPTNASLEQSLAATTSGEDKLNLALREIDRLREKLAEAQGPLVTGLRKRGGAAASTAVAGAETAVEKVKEVHNSSAGVPIEIAGALMLVVFVLTYLFF